MPRALSTYRFFYITVPTVYLNSGPGVNAGLHPLLAAQVPLKILSGLLSLLGDFQMQSKKAAGLQVLAFGKAFIISGSASYAGFIMLAIEAAILTLVLSRGWIRATFGREATFP